MCKNKQELKNKMKFIIIAIQFSLLLLFIGIRIFKKLEKRFAEEL